MIKKFLEFSAVRLNYDDIVLCVCDLLDEGFYLTDDLSDLSDNEYDDEIFLHKAGAAVSNYLLYGVVYTSNYQLNKRNFSKEQEIILELAKSAASKLSDVSGFVYYGEIDFHRYGTNIVFMQKS